MFRNLLDKNFSYVFAGELAFDAEVPLKPLVIFNICVVGKPVAGNKQHWCTCVAVNCKGSLWDASGAQLVLTRGKLHALVVHFSFSTRHNFVYLNSSKQGVVIFV